MIKLINVKKEIGDKLLFDKVNLTIYEGERVGIVGSNGAGKTTLAKIIAGLMDADLGKVETTGETIGYLKQASEYVLNDFLGLASDSIFVSRFLELKSKLNIADDIQFTKERLGTLSGGERTKLMLAHILSIEPSVLLLDEPTNHVDADSIKWLTDVINSYLGIVIVISHDRAFLNAVVSKIIEIENGKVSEYYGDYNDYKEAKAAELDLQKAKFTAQTSFERKVEKQIQSLTAWSTKGENTSRRQGGMLSDSKLTGAQTRAQAGAAKLAKQAKNKAARLEQLKADSIEKPYEEKAVHFNINTDFIGSKLLLKATNLSKYFEDNLLFENINFEITNKDRIALTGANGAGKTTLINMLFGKEPISSGEVWKTKSLKPAILSQDVFDLDDKKTIFELAHDFPSEQRTLFLTNLANMNLHRSRFDQKIGTLSLGERMRVKLAILILSDANLIILDEPTNHLDINNLQELERVLADYKGALLIVSHDNYFVDKVATSKYEIRNKKLCRIM